MPSPSAMAATPPVGRMGLDLAPPKDKEPAASVELVGAVITLSPAAATHFSFRPRAELWFKHTRRLATGVPNTGIASKIRGALRWDSSISAGRVVGVLNTLLAQRQYQHAGRALS